MRVHYHADESILFEWDSAHKQMRLRVEVGPTACEIHLSPMETRCLGQCLVTYAELQEN